MVAVTVAVLLGVAMMGDSKAEVATAREVGAKAREEAARGMAVAGRVVAAMVVGLVAVAMVEAGGAAVARAGVVMVTVEALEREAVGLVEGEVAAAAAAARSRELVADTRVEEGLVAEAMVEEVAEDSVAEAMVEEAAEDSVAVAMVEEVARVVGLMVGKVEAGLMAMAKEEVEAMAVVTGRGHRTRKQPPPLPDTL